MFGAGDGNWTHLSEHCSILRVTANLLQPAAWTVRPSVTHSVERINPGAPPANTRSQSYLINLNRTLKIQGTVLNRDEIVQTVSYLSWFRVVYSDHSSKISSFTSEAIRAAMTPDTAHASLSSFLLKMSQEKGIRARPKVKWWTCVFFT